jgi:hypothetical protein
MAKSKIQVELRNEEKNLGDRYSKFIRLFLLLTIIFIIIAAIVFIGIFILGAGHNWALLSIDFWFILIIVLILIFILLNIIFYIHYRSFQKKRIDLEKPKPEYIDGKRVFVYTVPVNMEGGIFSKTYIEIDKNSILRLRTLIIPPKELL